MVTFAGQGSAKFKKHASGKNLQNSLFKNKKNLTELEMQLQ